MDPFTLIIIIVIATTVYWPEIVKYFSESVIPWARVNLSEGVASTIADVIVFADDKVCSVRRFTKSMLETFKNTVLGSKTRIEKIDATTAKQINTDLIKTHDNRFMQRVHEDIIRYEDIPEEIRSEMLKQNKKAAELDLRKAVIEKVEARAEKEGLVEVLTA
jgi:hypothetical protein